MRADLPLRNAANAESKRLELCAHLPRWHGCPVSRLPGFTLVPKVVRSSAG
jgi:hypothetical protein